MHAGPLSEPIVVEPPATPDAAIVARLRRGDLTAVELLFKRYAASLLGLATRITGSPANAEDIVQDVFVGLPVAIRNYAENGQFVAWLHRVTVRTCLMFLRRDQRRNEVSLDEERSSNPSDTMLDRLALEEAINKLPTPLRIVFVLKEIEHYTHAEIASLLGIRKGTSEVRLFRAIRILRTTLERHDD